MNCSIEENNNAKLLLAYIRKIQHITDNKTILLMKTIVGREKSDISIRKVWVLQ